MRSKHIGRAGRDGNAAVAVMLFHPGIIAKCFSLWVADKNVQTMNQNFRDVQNMMSFIYSSQCRRKFVRKILENIEDNVPLNGNCNCDTCEETHIIQRDIGPAMRLLLSAIKTYISCLYHSNF
jgi:superfamily II DNA helicase RecQ